MLELKDFMPINFLKKEKFTGSHKGLRFRMEKLEEEKEHLKTSFDADGIARGVDWINERLTEEKERWKAALHHQTS